MVNGLLEKGKITKDGDVFVLNLNKLGYQKLLGTGTTNLKLRVTVNNCSASAEKKIVAAGGEVIKTKKAAKTGKATEKESGKETVVEKVNKKEQPEKDNQEEN
jgi:ribosomal protein L18E